MKVLLKLGKAGGVRVQLLAIVAGLSLILSVAAFSSQWSIAVVCFGLMQAILIMIVVQSRHVLSKRIFSVSRQVEKRIERGKTTKALTNVAVPKPASNGGLPAESGGRKKASKGEVGSNSTTSTIPLESATAMILASRIFDQEWYEVQVDGKFDSRRDACRHYLSRGRRSGFTPHPLFIPSWVDEAWRTSAVDPLVKYLSDPQLNRVAPTHPLFDPAHMDEGLKKALDRDWGALSTFLALAGPKTPLPYDSALSANRPVSTLATLRKMLLAESKLWRAREMTYAPLRGSSAAPEASGEVQEALEI
ncbi:hypothetical protein AB4Y86_14775, partial [Arthrobacter sp. 2YAF22_2]|uniref:hypothetical protein n=1 Tax=Arthrobacter sp. 2YAF22_2 TaxID=3233029 RepID=UPI003F9363F6